MILSGGVLASEGGAAGFFAGRIPRSRSGTADGLAAPAAADFGRGHGVGLHRHQEPLIAEGAGGGGCDAGRSLADPSGAVQVGPELPDVLVTIARIDGDGLGEDKLHRVGHLHTFTPRG